MQYVGEILQNIYGRFNKHTTEFKYQYANVLYVSHISITKQREKHWKLKLCTVQTMRKLVNQ